jgi:hypothetical protein
VLLQDEWFAEVELARMLLHLENSPKERGSEALAARIAHAAFSKLAQPAPARHLWAHQQSMPPLKHHFHHHQHPHNHSQHQRQQELGSALRRARVGVLRMVSALEREHLAFVLEAQSALGNMFGELEAINSSTWRQRRLSGRMSPQAAEQPVDGPPEADPAPTTLGLPGYMPTPEPPYAPPALPLSSPSQVDARPVMESLSQHGDSDIRNAAAVHPLPIAETSNPPGEVRLNIEPPRGSWGDSGRSSENGMALGDMNFWTLGPEAEVEESRRSSAEEQRAIESMWEEPGRGMEQRTGQEQVRNINRRSSAPQLPQTITEGSGDSDPEAPSPPPTESSVERPASMADVRRRQ